MRSFDKPKHIEKSIADLKKDTKKVGIEMDWDTYENMCMYKVKNKITIKDLIQKAVKEYIQK